MNIRGKFVLLRAMEESDQDMLLSMINDPEIERLVGGYSFPTSREQQMTWFRANQNDIRNIRLVICTEQDGPVGFANIVNIDWKNRTAFHGIKLASRQFQAKGIGTDTVMAVMRYAFEELQLNRLDGSILPFNESSKKLYCGKCGWSIEGVRRNAVFKGNELHDEIMVGILRGEYYELVNKTNYWSL